MMRRLRELEEAGHIEKAPAVKGKRAFYVLTSPVFGQKQRDGVQETARAPSGGRRLVSVRKVSA